LSSNMLTSLMSAFIPQVAKLSWWGLGRLVLTGNVVTVAGTVISALQSREVTTAVTQATGVTVTWLRENSSVADIVLRLVAFAIFAGRWVSTWGVFMLMFPVIISSLSFIFSGVAGTTEFLSLMITFLREHLPILWGMFLTFTSFLQYSINTVVEMSGVEVTQEAVKTVSWWGVISLAVVEFIYYWVPVSATDSAEFIEAILTYLVTKLETIPYLKLVIKPITSLFILCSSTCIAWGSTICGIFHPLWASIPGLPYLGTLILNWTWVPLTNWSLWCNPSVVSVWTVVVTWLTSW